jgi:cytochrome c-type protein NapC
VRYSLLALLLVGFTSGVFFWGGFNTAMEATNTMGFCIGCHEMRDNVYAEYKKTIHYTNRTGVRATCSDCHVPKDWTHKIIRKVQASNEVLHKVLGSIDTKEKFDAKRLTLARNEWNRMKASDSQECRNCHGFEAMNPENQRPRARKQHLSAMEAGNTCIDCHKGIAHKLPKGASRPSNGLPRSPTIAVLPACAKARVASAATRRRATSTST